MACICGHTQNRHRADGKCAVTVEVNPMERWDCACRGFLEVGPEERVVETLHRQIRSSAPLLARLEDCRVRIGKMCSQRRPPRMTIPVQWDDDDMFISETIAEAITEIEKFHSSAAANTAEV